MHFYLVCVIFFSSRSKVVKGVKRSNSILNWPKKWKISKPKNNYANTFFMDRNVILFTVAPLSDLQLRGQRSKKVKILKCMDWPLLLHTFMDFNQTWPGWPLGSPTHVTWLWPQFDLWPRCSGQNMILL